MKYLAIILIFLTTLIPTKSAGYTFTHITTKNSDLSYDGITTIMQDSRGFIWIGTFKGLNRYDGYSMKAYFKEDMGLNSDFVHVLTEDRNGNIWIGTDNGISIYNYSKDAFEHMDMLSDQGTIIHNKVTFISVDTDGTVRMLVNDQGCFSYSPKENKLRNTTYKHLGMSGFRRMLKCPDGDFYISRYHADLYHADSTLADVKPVRMSCPPQDYFANDEIEGIFYREDGKLYIASTQKGLSIFDPLKKTAEVIFDLPDGVLMHNVHMEQGKAFWFSTNTGVWRYDLRDGTHSHLRHNDKDEFSISNDYTQCTFVDKNGGIWIGTKDGGLNYSGTYQNNFEKQYIAEGVSLRGVLVSGFAEDDDGCIWVATEEMGFLRYDPDTHTTTQYRHDSIPSRICSVCHQDGSLWFGTRIGLFKLDIKSGKVRKYGILKREHGISDPSVYLIHLDYKSDILVGTTLGIFRYDRQTDSFVELKQFDGIFATSAVNDKTNPSTIWFSTFANGILKWDCHSESKPRQYSSKNNGGLFNNKIVSVFSDNASTIWSVGFSNGLYHYDKPSDKFAKSHVSGLESGVFFKGIEDTEGKLWLSSDIGLIKFDPKAEETYIYTERDGLLDSKFTNSALLSSTGDIYFGSDNGFIRFNPLSLSSETSTANVIISSMQIGDKEAHIGSNLDLTGTISLDHDQNSFGFGFSVLGSSLPSSHRIQCKLDGYDQEWKDILRSRSVFYYNVPAGQYQLLIRISTKEGDWQYGHQSVKIIIRPPFWNSPAGIALILLLIGLFTYLMVLSVQKNTLKKKEKEAEEYRKAKEEEIFMEKMNFFSHVIHEIKTPLTLIKTPLSNVMCKKRIDEEMKHDLEVMNNSAGYLTKLVNELLDYIRIEKMGFALKCEDVNIVEKLRSTMFNFSDTIRNNNLRLEFTSGLDNAIVSADIAALDKILNNLILNAVKYAESLIEIHIDSKDNEMVIIRFENDGAGIPTEYRDEVFKPFVQYHKNHNTHKSGVGIGLPLAKNLAKMHLGDLVLDDGEQTCFILTLPLKSTEALNREIPENSIQETSTDRETVLIADDNREFREYLASKLGGSYRTICVSDGKSAYEVMKEENIDIMISDISMPEINGLELCQTVRKDIELSHIPIIIISARVSIESKIQAMEAGADLYIEKPFDLEYMRSSVKNILDKRSLMKSAFGSGLVKTDINMFGLPKKDEEFFTKFDSIIRENLGNNDFSNEALAHLLNMSESTMLRKIKKLLNTSPNNYIKTVRLSVAADMLKDSHGNNISEICYTVGFSSVSYFAKCFREQYGMSPSEWCSRG